MLSAEPLVNRFAHNPSASSKSGEKASGDALRTSGSDSSLRVASY